MIAVVVDVAAVDVDVDAVDVAAVDAVDVVDVDVVFGLPVMRLDQKLSPQQQMPRKSFALVTHTRTNKQTIKK